MTILGLLLTLAVFGFVVWLIVTLIPMPGQIRSVIIGIACVLLLLWFCSEIGLLNGLNQPLVIRR